MAPASWLLPGLPGTVVINPGQSVALAPQYQTRGRWRVGYPCATSAAISHARATPQYWCRKRTGRPRRTQLAHISI